MGTKKETEKGKRRKIWKTTLKVENQAERDESKKEKINILRNMQAKKKTLPNKNCEGRYS